VPETNMTSAPRGCLLRAESRREKSTTRPRRRLALRLYPQLATAVWVGYPDAERGVYVPESHSPEATSRPSIWHDFMSPAMASMPERDFAAPKTAARFTPGPRGATVPRLNDYYPSTTTSATTTECDNDAGDNDAGDTHATTTKTTAPPVTTTAPPSLRPRRLSLRPPRLSRRATEQSVAVDAPFRPRAASVLCQRAEAMCEPLRSSNVGRSLAAG